MPTITINSNAWNRLADLVGDLGRCHPSYKDTDVGEDIYILGAAIRSSAHNSPELKTNIAQMADAVVEKRGGCYVAQTSVGRYIEMAERLLGLWTPAQIACKGLDPGEWATAFPTVPYPNKEVQDLWDKYCTGNQTSVPGQLG